MKPILPLIVAACLLVACDRGLRTEAVDGVSAVASDRSPFAINGLTYFHQHHKPEAEREAEYATRLEAMTDAGVKYDRLDFWWGAIEPEPDRWAWEHPDRAVELYRRHGLGVMAILCYNAAWADHSPHTPEGVADYAEYVRRMVERYRDEIKVWEVWNEPNIPTFWQSPPHNGPNAEHYVALLRAAYRAAKQADPTCTVVGCSTSLTDVDWLIEVGELGGFRYMDALSFHPYSLSGGPDEMLLGRQIENVAKTAARFGRPDMPLYITEMGWHAKNTDRASMHRQAAFLVQSYAISLAEGVEQLYWFCLKSWRVEGRDDWWESWGLLSPEDERKMSFDAYRVMTSRLDGAACRGYVYGERAKAVVFDRDDATLAVAWADPYAEGSLDLPAEARVFDLYGEEQDGAAGEIALTDVPVYLVFEGRVAWPGLSERRRDPDNLLARHSFEIIEADGQRVRGWDRGNFHGETHGDGTFLLVDDDAAHGERCVAIAAANDAHWQSWPVPAMPGERFTATVQVRASGATGESGVAITFIDGSGFAFRGGPTSEPIAGTTDGWVELRVSGTCPDDASWLRINLYSRGNEGRVQFDDVRVTGP